MKTWIVVTSCELALLSDKTGYLAMDLFLLGYNIQWHFFFPDKESREHALWNQESFEDLLFKSKILNCDTIPMKP